MIAEDPNSTMEERHVVNQLKEHGLKYVYDEATFYKMFKLSRKDFLDKLEKAGTEEKRDKIIMDIIYKSPKSEFGRRGVKSLNQSNKMTKR